MAFENTPFEHPLLVLLDSGSTSTWINHQAIPNGAQGQELAPLTVSTMAGTFSSSE